jgi:GT2 family glycosyltransferase
MSNKHSISIGTVLITYAIDVTPLIKSMDGPDVTWHIFVHSDRPEAKVCLRAVVQNKITFYDYRQNRGLAKSWNDGLLAAYTMDADAVIIANDDIQATHDDLLVLARAAVEHRECGVIVAEGFNVRMAEQQQLQFAIPAINPIALEQIGYFDENFTPIYFEDCDYSRRAGLAGVKFHNAGPTGIIHTGSATVGTVDELRLQNNTTFRLNYEYYCRKWGGPPGQEIFTIPFNDSRFDLNITAERRLAPYPGLDRTDLEVVKI